MMLRFLACAGLIVAGAAAHAATKPKPATALQITNGRDETATTVTISAGDRIVKLARPLAANGKTTLRLPKFTGCNVSVAATFADESVVELDDFDICKDHTIRFTE
jgi:hypothetical protein